MRRIVGVGVDVTSISRIARVRSRRDIITEVCADEESVLFPLTDADAARLWSGKEAIVKTLGTGFWQQGVDWTDIRFGADWQATLHGRARLYAGESSVEVSFEIRGDFVIATSRRWSTS